MRQNPVGEPAATAAWNFGTPRRRSSLKRLGPFCHCRQRYERSLRRIHASRLVSTLGVWQKPKYPRHPRRYGVRSSTNRVRLIPRVRRVLSRICTLNLSRALDAMRRSLPSFEMLIALLWSRHCAFRLVDLQPQLLCQEPAQRGHHAFTGAAAANIDVAVIGVAGKAVTPAGQLLVEIVEHEVAQEGREHSPNAKGNFHRAPAVCRLTAARCRRAALVGRGSSAGSGWCHCRPRLPLPGGGRLSAAQRFPAFPPTGVTAGGTRSGFRPGGGTIFGRRPDRGSPAVPPAWTARGRAVRASDGAVRRGTGDLPGRP